MGIAVPFRRLGRQPRITETTPINMKLLIVCALFALATAEPEADPQVWLDTMPYAASAHHTAGMVKHANGAVTPDDTLSVKLAKAKHMTAMAKEYMVKGMIPQVAPIVTKPLVYTKPVVTKPIAPVVTKPIVYTKPMVDTMITKPIVNTPLTYGMPMINPMITNPMINTPLTYGMPMINPMINPMMVKHFVKREAEAEPEAEPGMLYNNFGMGPTTYTAPVVTKPITYTKPIINTPLTYGMPMTYGMPWTYGLNHGLVKRDAEAEPIKLFYKDFGISKNFGFNFDVGFNKGFGILPRPRPTYGVTYLY